MRNHLIERLEQPTAGYTGGLGMLLNLVSDIYFDLARKKPSLVVEGQFLSNPEQVMDRYGLSEWQKKILYSWDREKLAAAIADEIVRTDPFEHLRGNLWPGPTRCVFTPVDERGHERCTIAQAARATVAVRTAGLCGVGGGPVPDFFLSRMSDDPGLKATRVISRGKDLENEIFEVTWDTSAVAPGAAFYIRAVDVAGPVLSGRAVTVAP